MESFVRICLISAIFAPTACSAAMEKRAQQDSGEERVTAKSRPMMNLTARMPTVVSSSTSSSPVKTWYEYQDPGKSVASDDRSGKPERPSPPGYSKEDYGQSWSVRMVDRSGQPDERNSSKAQMRTLLEEQRQTIIEEYRETVGHHELQAAHAEEERQILREELWRQQLEFREAHQQRLTEMEELRKFQNSTFDTLARRKLIEDQNTIMELSGKVQELQNEIN